MQRGARGTALTTDSTARKSKSKQQAVLNDGDKAKKEARYRSTSRNACVSRLENLMLRQMLKLTATRIVTSFAFIQIKKPLPLTHST